MVELILPFIAFTFDALGDKIKWGWKKTPGEDKLVHMYEFLILATWVIYIAYDLNWYWYLLYVSAVRLWYFDGLLNILKGQPFFYKGTISMIDRLFLGKKWLIITTWALALLTSILLVIIKIN